MKVGNASGFWGDDSEAPGRLVSQQPDLDFLTLDYLAEISLSIMAIQREKDPKKGYAGDFIEAIKALIPSWKQGSKVKIVTNAGGLNPLGCAEACLAELKKADLSLKIAAITGDDVLAVVQNDASNPLYRNLETGAPLTHKLVAANAYIGAQAIAESIKNNAQIIIGGRIADPSLTVGPCLAHFNWNPKDYNKIAGATIAGHLIECGTQATGGISTDWLTLPNASESGFPIAEISPDGTFILTKPPGTGGAVTESIVKEQLLYEIGDPNAYLSPDATVSFLSLSLKDLRSDRVQVQGAKGAAPTDTYKVSAAYPAGYKAEAFLTLFGRNVRDKAKRAGEIVLEKLREAGLAPERSKIECLGTGDLVPGIFSNPNTLECVLRIAVADPRYEVLERFSKEIAPLVTSGPQGTTGYLSGRPKIRPVFGYWPCLVQKNKLSLQVHYF